MNQIIYTTFNRLAKVILKLPSFFISKKHKKRYRKTINDLFVPKLDTNLYQKIPKILSCSETLNLIVNEKKSIARFGDGEFNIILKRKASNHFQEANVELKEKLKEVLLSPHDKCLTALNSYIKERGIPKGSRWDLWKRKYLKRLIAFLNSEYLYADALCFCHKSFKAGFLLQIKQIWDSRDIVLITGKGSTFILDDRLFGNSNSIEIIYTKAINAFNEYEKIINKVKALPQSKLILISAGMTATCWAWELSKHGYQVIDIGHISNYYLESIGEAKNIEQQRQEGLFTDGNR